MEKEAQYYQKLANGAVSCRLCPHYCLIENGGTGKCHSRVNRDGTLFTRSYGETVSLSLDPIEKKPLYHFKPGSVILSTGPCGCNFSCSFCQNWQISQMIVPTERISPEKLAEMASYRGSIGIAYTYTEPTIWFEFIMDTGALVHKRGLVNVLVTNGFIAPEPLEELLPIADAMNIDLKSMDESFYTEHCGGSLKPVLATIEAAYGYNTHIEITNLLIPGLNDSDEQITRLVEFIASLSPNIPLHISRYFPAYRMTRPATPVASLERAYRIAKERLRYVYVGNFDHPESRNTYCVCGNLLIERWGFTARSVGIENGKCNVCGAPFDGVV